MDPGNAVRHVGIHPGSSGSPLQNHSLLALIWCSQSSYVCVFGKKEESLKESHTDTVRTNETLHERLVLDPQTHELNCTDKLVLVANRNGMKSDMMSETTRKRSDKNCVTASKLRRRARSETFRNVSPDM